MAQWPTNQAAAFQLNDPSGTALDDRMAKGPIIAVGWFLDGRSGDTIGEDEAVTTGTHVTRFSSYLDMTAEEISPYAVGNQATQARWNALMTAK
jgi:hypothetical protein